MSTKTQGALAVGDFSEIKDVNQLVAILFIIVAVICAVLYFKEEDPIMLILAIAFALIGIFGTSLIVGWL